MQTSREKTRQTCRQADRQTDRQKYRQAARKTAKDRHTKKKYTNIPENRPVEFETVHGNIGMQSAHMF